MKPNYGYEKYKKEAAKKKKQEAKRQRKLEREDGKQDKNEKA